MRPIARAWIVLFVGGLILVILLPGELRELLGLPLWYTWVLASLVLSSLPQGMVWFVFVLVVFFVGLLTLLYGPARRRTEPLDPVVLEGRVAGLARWIRQAEEGAYFKWRLAQRLGVLALDLIAQNDPDRPEMIKRRLRTQGFPSPPELAAYFAAGLFSVSGKTPSRVGRLFRASPDSPLDLPVDKVVSYLEQYQEGEVDEQ